MSELLLHNMAVVLTVVLTGCVLNKRDQKSSLPCFEVCNAEAVCGVQSNTAIPNNAAQQWSQLRWNPVQRNLRGHVVHFNQLKICTDTFTIQYTTLMIGSLHGVLFKKLLIFTPQIILIKQNLTIKMGMQIEVMWQSNLRVTRFRQNTTAADYYGNYITGHYCTFKFLYVGMSL